MSYIGRSPQIGAYSKLDSITTDGSASYTMQLNSANFVPESVNHLIVSVNGVIQAPTDSFTVSGSTITFASSLSASDTIDFIMALGNVLDIGVPSDATVSTSKIIDNAVTSAKLFSSFANGLTNINYQTFTSSGTYTPTTGMAFCEVYCTGGGGGAGGTDGNDTSCSLASGGGGAGGTAIKIYSATEIGASATVTIGSGGSGGNGATSGSSGGNSTFIPAGTGGTITGNGGNGSSGYNGGGDEARRGADGGGASGGDLNLNGEHGHHGETSNDGVIGGNGGSSFFERGGLANDRARNDGSGTTGVAGSKGSGGGGTVVRNDTGTSTGGAGGSGFVVVKEFING
jgi:hypothetical protein